MDRSIIEILGLIISVVIIAFAGGLIGWLFGYKAGYHKATRPTVVQCPCSQCGGTMHDHFHGCPIATEFKLMTIAKPGG